MNPNRDFDQLMRTWVDAGEDRLPTAYLHEALVRIEKTRQRGAAWALLEELIMRIQPIAVPLAIGALLVVAVGTFAVVSRPAVGDPEPPAATDAATVDPTAEPTVEPTRSAAADADLDFIAFTGQEVILGLTQDSETEGVPARAAGLREGGAGASIDPTGFVDARANTFSGNANHDARSPVILFTYAAEFESVEDAERAYHEMRDHHEAASGWGLEPETALPVLGDEAVSYNGTRFGGDPVIVYLWRSGSLVLATAGMDRTERIHVLQVARRMDERAR